MTKYKYAFKGMKENVVKAVARDIALSPKAAFEICKFIKGKEVAKAKAILEKVKEKKLAIPYTRATEGAGHKGGMAGGKYPLKGSIEFLKLLKQLEANAQSKGLSANIKIIHACAQRAAEPFRTGRKRRVQSKRCHVEVAAQEQSKGTLLARGTVRSPEFEAAKHAKKEKKQGKGKEPVHKATDSKENNA
jgi:large subunit ribosomal protein L22